MSDKIKGRIVHKMYGKIAALGGDTIEIVRDDLRHRYGGTHRYHLKIHAETEAALCVFRATLFADMMQEGWTQMAPVGLEKFSDAKNWLSSERDGKKVFVCISTVMAQGPWSRFDVSVDAE